MHKIYANGKQFLDDNFEIVRANLHQTAFFELDAAAMQVCDKLNFAAKVWQDDKILLGMRLAPFAFVLFGDESLAAEFAQLAVDSGWQFSSVLGCENICESFLQCYEKLCGGSHKILHSMDIMTCNSVVPCDVSGVRWATANDLPAIKKLVRQFTLEALGQDAPVPNDDNIEKSISGYAVLQVGGEIVSIVKRQNATSILDRISAVYTLPNFRNRGFSRKAVTFVTQSILSSGKQVQLYVDKANPVSNHLYQKIGYGYIAPQYEIAYLPPN